MTHRQRQTDASAAAALEYVVCLLALGIAEKSGRDTASWL